MENEEMEKSRREAIQFAEEWIELAKNNPEEFERRRREEIEKYISELTFEDQIKARHLQWKIDMAVAKCKTPMQAALKLNGMLMNQVYGEDGLLDALQFEHSEIRKIINESKVKSKAKLSNVVNLPIKNDHHH